MDEPTNKRSDGQPLFVPGAGGWRRLWTAFGDEAAAPVWLLVVLVIGAVLRFTGLDWDEGQHLHPDERFLTMVETALGWPTSLQQYFDTAKNPLSPYNHDYGFFVYGTLPLYLVKWVGLLLDRSGYDQIHLVGRALSGLFDLGSILVVYFVGRRLYGWRVGLLGAALLSLSVLNIQQSHFFTVDTFANFFVVLAFYFAVRIAAGGHWWEYALFGLSLGAGVASKVSVFTLGAVAAAAAGLHLYRVYQRRQSDLYVILEQTVVRLVLAAVLSVLTFRFLQPIAFQGPGFLDFSLNERWLANMREVSDMMTGARDMPPGHQWTNRAALLFPWQNMVLWGLGLPLGLAAWAGWGLGAYELLRRGRLNHLLPVLYVALVFLHQGTQFVKTMRYLLPIYPFLALLAAYLLVRVWDGAAKRRASAGWGAAEAGAVPAGRLAGLAGALTRRVAPRDLAAALLVAVVGGTLLYALAFTSIYTRPHSRVEASRWIYENVPKGSVLANEHWDDGLPLRVDGKDGFGGWYKGVEIPNYNEDTPEKLNLLVERLTEADYVILSSNRLYDSIPRLPMRYPMTTRYYRLLFAEQLGFAKVAEFTSYPQLLGISLPDQSAEEAFSVYDHPKVTIFKKTEAFAPQTVARLLGEGIDWDSIIRVPAVQAPQVREGLNLPTGEREVYAGEGTWSQLFDRDGWANRWPLLAWGLALTALGLLATPLAFVGLGRLADRGFAFAKALGMLLVGWGAWLLASGRVVTFGPAALALPITALAVASGLIVWRRWGEVTTFWRRSWRLVVVEEGLFWALFLAFVLVRAGNPDLWHPWMGGEKPMDFAFLNAVVKTAYFPPYDPWWAGGYVNYYYFGFVLVAVLVKLTGIVPQVAYNLAVPTFFALTATGGFAAALNLAVGRQNRLARADRPHASPAGEVRRLLPVGLAGAAFVAVLGNLGELRLLLKGMQDVSKVNFETTIPGLLGLAKALDGARAVLWQGQNLPFRPEWWYWNASRLIPHPPTEAGPINEFPYFTFLFGDLHAHMMALPYTLLALAFAINFVRSGAGGPKAAGASTPADPGRFSLVARLGGKAAGLLRLQRLVPAECGREVATLLLPALVVGALWPLNTWDFPTYAVLMGAALACREYQRRGRVDLGGVWALAWRWGLVLILGWGLFLPFHRSYASAYGSVEPWRGSRTPLDAYLTIHGFFLFLIASYLWVELRHGCGHNGTVRLLRQMLGRWQRGGRLRRLHARLVRPSPWHRLALDAVSAFAFAVIGLLVLRQAVSAVVVALLLPTTLLMLSPRPEPRRQFVLCLVGLGLLLTLVVEYVVLKGDVSRMNTVFKFYLQVWVMWAVATAAALPALCGRLGRSRDLETPQSAGVAASRPTDALLPVAEEARPLVSGGRWRGGNGDAALGWPASPRWGSLAGTGESSGIEGPGFIWQAAFVALLLGCLLYPIFATWGRVNDRFDKTVGATLDGAAYMERAVYADQGKTFALKWDAAAIAWLQDNVPGTPTIVEAVTPIYRWGSRVSIYTGLPTVLGWDWHEKQQRAVLPGELVDRRASDVRSIYDSTDPAVAFALLRRYGVQYIYVGPLERAYYSPAGLAKFERSAGTYWDLAYENPEVRIYRLRAAGG